MPRSYDQPLDGEILGPDVPDPEAFGPKAGREKRVRARFFRTLKKAGRQIPFLESVIASYYCALDPATPPKVRGTLLAALAYFVLPLDAVPDFLLVVGFSDDVTVLMAALTLVQTHIRDEHREAARKVLAEDPDLKG